LTKFDMSDDLEDWINLEAELASGGPTEHAGLAAAPPAKAPAPDGGKAPGSH
jgi:hypothetical protein